MTDPFMFNGLSFKQTGDSCQIAALGVVHYYFSKCRSLYPNYLKDTIHFSFLFITYLDYIRCLPDFSPEERQKYLSETPVGDAAGLENKVHEVYLGYCEKRKIKGSEHIADFSNYLCKQKNAQKIKSIPHHTLRSVREDIINALQKEHVLIAALINNNNHWVVLGYGKGINGEGPYIINTAQGNQLVQPITESDIEIVGITEYIKYSL